MLSVFDQLFERESKQLDVAIRKRNDRLFNNRIEDAMRRFRTAERAATAANPDFHYSIYEDGECEVRSVGIEYSPEIGYGVHFKDTDEFGMHTFYVYDDDDSGRVSRRNYRSDFSFRKRDSLHV